MTLLVVFLRCYLTHVFWKSISTTTRIVDRDGVNQVCTNSQDTNYYLTQLLIATIFSSFSKILTKDLDICSCSNNELTISRLCFYFFMRFEEFLFFIKLLLFLAISIYLSNTGKKLECSFAFGLNSLIKHLVLKV